MKFVVKCFDCGREFDFFAATWCERHRLGAHSKVCPHCERCACGNKPAWDVWRRYQREFRRYGAPRAIDWKKFLVDGVSASILWVLIWLVVYVVTGIALDKIVFLLGWVVFLNMVAGGLQGRWMDFFRRKFKLE